MSTEPATTEDVGPGGPETGPAPGTEEGATARPEAESAGAGAEPVGAGVEGDGDGGPAGTADSGETVSEEVGATGPGSGEAGSGGAGSGEDGTPEADEVDGSADAGASPAPRLSEAEAEIAAQREERARIERRRAERNEPVESGTKLSGTAAELLAAVRAVEGGQKPALTFDEPRRAPEPRRPAPEPARRQVSAPPAPPAPPVADSVDAVAAVLTEGGAPAALAPPTAAELGSDAPGLLRSDPWQLLRVPGVRPEQADGFARALLGAECGPGDERRGRSLAVWLLEQAAAAGHTALDVAALSAALGQRSVPDPDEAVHSAIGEGDVLVFQDALDPSDASAPPPAPSADAEDGEEEAPERPVRVLVGLERYAMAEESLADGLARVVNAVRQDDAEEAAGWKSAAAEAGRSAGELIGAVAGHGVVLHTGGEAARAEPVALLAAAASLGLRAYAATHTADGRGRLAGRTGEETPVVTVAGLLAGTEGPGRDGDGALALDLLVVLDAPQLDVESAALLAESVPDGARLVLSGDPGTLWSTGPGRVFADLLAARVCPHVVSRTPDPGPLGELVSGIGIGELNAVEAPGKEVVIVPVSDPGEAVHRTVQLVVDSVPRAIGVPAEDTQVIVPGHGGAAGTRVLNAALKERLNPGPGRFGGFDPGDRVAYTEAPGRTTVGQVAGADAEGLRLECDGGPVLVPRERVERSVRHGWALTVQQAAGRRPKAAVVVLPGDTAPGLNRPWVYTAFGLPERHLSVVQGVDQALPRAVAGVPAKERTTRLGTLLRAQLPAAG
ncbi:helix-hairpin-helix domain-containing protein [Streptomyces tsukubensis]|uniref:DNA helicase RecD n=1 Tax=Streptomyces tsukubensis TaxID=83656 RepID=A0A1V4AFA9_9ACTN|nr:helix-hairpin-helix domain-containing protein [Streptomyces tsukubensis]OON82293.1 DNA helicase RecD [Streptomyces tsukubensis]QFR92782.1 DNA helicase RecD [Streptomyces tsukubensis]